MSESPESQQLVLLDREGGEASNGATPLRSEQQVWHLRRAIPAGLALLGCALLVLSAVTRQPVASRSKVRGSAASSIDWPVELVEENGEDPCAALPNVRLEKVLHSNLGGKGPDEGEEGVIFQAFAYHAGVQSKVVQVHLHALSDYNPTWPKANGIHGYFGELNLAPGTNTTFQVYAVDPETNQNLTLSHGSFTFFDLDHGKNKRSAEYVRVGGFSHYYIANNTELDVVQHKDQTVTFRAGKEGDGGDNPTDPLALSPLQKRRAVTLNFQNLTSITFVLGGTEGNTTRVFHFVLRPSLLCADTVLEDGAVLKALERAAGNVVPLQDGQAPVSAADVKRLADDYDCADGSEASGWPDAKKAWCCDRKDIGCELLGIGEDGELSSDGDETEENGTAGDAATPTPSHSRAARPGGVAITGPLLQASAAVLAWLSARALAQA